MLDAVEEQSLKTTESVTGIRELMKKYRKITSSKLPKIYSAELVEYLFSYSFYSQSTMQRKLSISSRNTASKYFSELVGIGILEEKKYKNEKVYFCPEFHHLLK
jgi:Fic family protein